MLSNYLPLIYWKANYKDSNFPSFLCSPINLTAKMDNSSFKKFNPYSNPKTKTPKHGCYMGATIYFSRCLLKLTQNIYNLLYTFLERRTFHNILLFLPLALPLYSMLDLFVFFLTSWLNRKHP